MSVATQISRLQGLRDRIKAKLSSLGIGSGVTDLEDCTDAIESIGGTQLITDTTTVDVAGKQYARVDDANLSPSNIVSGVSILGVTGTANVQPPQANLTTGTFLYGMAAAPSTLTPPSGYDGFSQVTPTIGFNPTLLPANIKDGVTIMGVTGTLDAWNVYTLTVNSTTDTIEIPFDFVPTDSNYTKNFYISLMLYFDGTGGGTVPVGSSKIVTDLAGSVGSFHANEVRTNDYVRIVHLAGSTITTQFLQRGGIEIAVNTGVGTVFNGDYKVTIFWR